MEIGEEVESPRAARVIKMQMIMKWPQEFWAQSKLMDELDS